jgi:hypothetical protein
MGSSEGCFGGLQFSNQFGLSIIGTLNGSFDSMSNNFSLAKDRPAVDRTVFSLDSASCAAASYVVSAIG